MGDRVAEVRAGVSHFVLTQARVQDASPVREIMLAAFAEYDGAVHPHPSALRETLKAKESSIRDMAKRLS